MPHPQSVVNLDEKFTTFDDRWSPKTIAQMNDLHIKIVKVEGDFVWHSHPDTDELFLVHDGELTIEMRDAPSVTLGPGDLYVVPRGVEHRPLAKHECRALLIEPAGVVNTGDAAPGRLTADTTWI